MLEEKKTLLDHNSFLSQRRKRKMLSISEKRKQHALILSVFLCLILIALTYFLSSISNIYRITVDGNNYLDDEDIIELSKLSTRNKYLLTIPSTIEKRIKENPLIEDCSVSLLDNSHVSINVTEKKIIGYVYNGQTSDLLLANDERIPLEKENMYLINKVPLIEGFTNEELIMLEKNFTDCDYQIINEISEIHKYPDLKYQDVELVMRDGNYIFTSAYGLNILNRYYDIESSYARDRHSCYYFEDISGNAYVSACPWEKVEDNKEDSEQENIDQEEDDDE